MTFGWAGLREKLLCAQHGMQRHHVANMLHCARELRRRIRNVPHMDQIVGILESVLTPLAKHKDVRQFLGQSINEAAKTCARLHEHKSLRRYANSLIKLGGIYKEQGETYLQHGRNHGAKPAPKRK